MALLARDVLYEKEPSGRQNPDHAGIQLASRVGGKKLVDRLSTKAKVEDGKSVTSSAQPNCPS